MNCDILKSKLILCEWNTFYFIEIAFIRFTLDEIKGVYSFFWDTRYIYPTSIPTLLDRQNINNNIITKKNELPRLQETNI